MSSTARTNNAIIYDLNKFNQLETDFNNVVCTKDQTFFEQYTQLVNTLNVPISEELFENTFDYLERERYFICSYDKTKNNGWNWNFVLFDNNLLLVKCNHTTEKKKSKEQTEEETEPEIDNSVQFYIPQILKAYGLEQADFSKWKKHYLSLDKNAKISDKSCKWMYVNMLIPFLTFSCKDFLIRVSNKIFALPEFKGEITTATNSLNAKCIQKAQSRKKVEEPQKKSVVIMNVLPFTPDESNPADKMIFEAEKTKPLTPQIKVVPVGTNLTEDKFTGIKHKKVKGEVYDSQARKEILVIEDLPPETSSKLVFNYLKSINSPLIDTEKDVGKIIGCIILNSNVNKQQFNKIKVGLPAFIQEFVDEKAAKEEAKKAEAKAKQELKQQEEAKLPQKPTRGAAKTKQEPKKTQAKNITDDIPDDVNLDDEIDVPSKPPKKTTTTKKSTTKAQPKQEPKTAAKKTKAQPKQIIEDDNDNDNQEIQIDNDDVILEDY